MEINIYKYPSSTAGVCIFTRYAENAETESYSHVSNGNFNQIELENQRKMNDNPICPKYT